MALRMGTWEWTLLYTLFLYIRDAADDTYALPTIASMRAGQLKDKCLLDDEPHTSIVMEA